MATKDDVVNLIKRWLHYDKELKVLQKEAKKRREEKSKITNNLVEIMKMNDIDSFDIKDGKIQKTQRNVKAPLSKTHLMESLSKFFENDPSFQAEELGNFILETRKVSVKEEIRHKISKNIE
tara:strand:+ start:59 stop:424 length:366 start_codon:yes stop_codon:yes gene_type:complete